MQKQSCWLVTASIHLLLVVLGHLSEQLLIILASVLEFVRWYD